MAYFTVACDAFEQRAWQQASVSCSCMLRLVGRSVSQLSAFTHQDAKGSRLKGLDATPNLARKAGTGYKGTDEK